MASCPLDPQLICRLPGADPNLYVVNRSKDSFRHGLSFWQEKDDCAARENKPVLIWSSTVQNAFTFYPALFIFIFESVIMSVFCSIVPQVDMVTIIYQYFKILESWGHLSHNKKKLSDWIKTTLWTQCSSKDDDFYCCLFKAIRLSNVQVQTTFYTEKR